MRTASDCFIFFLLSAGEGTEEHNDSGQDGADAQADPDVGAARSGNRHLFGMRGLVDDVDRIADLHIIGTLREVLKVLCSADGISDIDCLGVAVLGIRRRYDVDVVDDGCRGRVGVVCDLDDLVCADDDKKNAGSRKYNRKQER